MNNYNEKRILGESFGLDDNQRNFILFEERSLREKYLNYLETAQNETAMQYFLESNPVFLPGLYDRHNGPLGQAVISKLKLGTEFVTDFAFISENSAEAQIALIEIESPSFRFLERLTASFRRVFMEPTNKSAIGGCGQTKMEHI